MLHADRPDEARQRAFVVSHGPEREGGRKVVTAQDLDRSPPHAQKKSLVETPISK